MKNEIRPKARKKNIVVQNMPDEVLVYDMESSKAHCLNQTVATVWQACDGNTDVSAIARAFGAENEANEDVVWLAIDQLQKHDLLEKDLELGLSGQSRRDMIKKVGFATAVALPVIASLAAPSSALAAASCLCTAPIECIPQTTCPSTMNCAPTGICSP
ncbi:MAG: PqqD family protein [Pyrinomonadaceae bacterium]|nr:PqqD family protein [Pyrinomonadaceae bacterium]